MSTASRISFAVSDVPTGTFPYQGVPLRRALEGKVGPVESCLEMVEPVVTGNNALMTAAWLAFQHHLPLVLSPDMLWVTMLQGLANHVNQNPETMRSRLVRHADRQSIQVRRDDFIKGRFENPWPEVFSAFSSGIQASLVEGRYGSLMPRFSTTGPVEQAAFEVALMDVMQSFFEYEMSTLCGIPQVILEGTTDDWRRLSQHTAVLRDFDLNWWADDLERILNEFVAASLGHIERRFWSSLYNEDDGSGGPYISGWMTHFIPYLLQGGREGATLSMRRNPYIEKQQDLAPEMSGLNSNQFSRSLSQVPFRWEVLGHTYEMEFLSGLVAIQLDTASGGVRPCMGWAVRDKGSAPN